MSKIITKSPEQTRRIGYKLAKKLKSGAILALIGNLGSGKTTFIQGLASGLGIKKKIVSPSFIMLKPYRVKKRGILYLYHFDLYRIKDLTKLKSMGLDEYFSSKNGVVVIEWADRALKSLPKNRKIIRFKFINPHSREIKI